MNRIIFVLLYIFPMTLTYTLRFALIEEIFKMDLSEEQIAQGANLAIFGLLICYLIMLTVTYFRGRRVGKSYITIYPFIGGFFDIVLAFIPFVPSVMNILALINGVTSKDESKSRS